MENKEYIALGKAFELFLTNERFRILGTSNLGEPGYQHIGMEIWTKYTDFDKSWNEVNKSIIYNYILGMKGINSGETNPTIEDLISAFSEVKS